jgi:hypothetical protein
LYFNGLYWLCYLLLKKQTNLYKKAQLIAGLFNFLSFFGFLETGGANGTEPVGRKDLDLPGRAG